MSLERQPDIFAFLLFQVAAYDDACGHYVIPPTLGRLEQNMFDHLVRRVIDRARTPDEYELYSTTTDYSYNNNDDNSSVHCIGSYAGDDRVLWHNQWWSIEDFFSLLIAVDDYATALANSAYALDERGQSILVAEQEKLEDERYLNHLMSDTVLVGRSNELKWVLLLFSCAYDTRIERLFCKRSNVLSEELQFDGVSVSKVLTMRRAIPTILKTYVRGQCTLSDLIAVVIDAYTVSGTMTMGSAPDEPALGNDNDDKSVQLFSPFMSSLDEPDRPNLFVLNSCYPLTPLLSLQLSQGVARNSPIITPSSPPVGQVEPDTMSQSNVM